MQRFAHPEAAAWRFDFLKRNLWPFDLYDITGTRGVSNEEFEMDKPTFMNCFILNGYEEYVVPFLELIDHSLSINTERKYWKYSGYLQKMALAYFKKLNRKEHLNEIRNRVCRHINQIAVQKFYPLLREAELDILNRTEGMSIQWAVNLYNETRFRKYQQVRNETDLLYLVRDALKNFENMIRQEGLYRPLTSGKKSVDEVLIQKTLNVALESCLLKKGLRDIDILREVALYDDKRTDILVKYGFTGPIMMELKLLHNPEITNETKRKEYKEKLLQYIRGSHAKHSFYLVFHVGNLSGKDPETIFRTLQEEYSDIENLEVLLINCCG